MPRQKPSERAIRKKIRPARRAASTARKRAKTSGTNRPFPPVAREPKLTIERTQLGVRMEKRLAKVLKGIAEYCDLTLAEMLEEIVLHAFEGESTFGPNTRRKIADLKKVYNLDYDAHASFRFAENRKAD